MRKILALLLAVAMLLVMFAGCSNKKQKNPVNDAGKTEAASEEPEKKPSVSSLKVWMPPFGTEDTLDKELWEGVTAPFAEKKGIDIKIEIIPWSNYEEKYLTGITSGAGPDVGYMYMEMISDFIDMGALVPFDEYLTEEERDKFYYLDKGVIKGKQYCLPIVVGNPRILVYNKDILEKAGYQEAPETWEDFVEVCKNIETDTDGDGKDDIYRFLLPFGNPTIGALNSIFYPLLWQAGGDIFNEQGTEVAFNSEAGLKAARFLYDLRFTYNILPEIVTSLDTKQTHTYFKEGKTAFIVGDTRRTSQYADTDINWDYVTSLKDKNGGTFVAADSLVMLSATEDKELTTELIKHMLSGESMSEFHAMSPFPPIANDEEYADDERFRKIYEQQQDYLYTLKPVAGSFKIYDYLYKNLQLMIIGEISPEKALKDSAEYSKSILSP